MNVAALPASDLRDRLAGAGLAWRSGPFTLHLRSDLDSVHRGFGLLYAHHEVVEPGSWVDFAVRIERPRGLRRWIRPQVRFLFDDAPVFEPLPTEHALPLTEWALNWCISSHAHQYLVLHAAVVAKGDRAAVLPAPPGSGKSTLCAALVNRGWRLLSDELALIDLADSRLWPLVRPVSLKNRSIDLIGGFAPDAVFSERTVDTHKGTVALMRPKPEDVLASGRPARAAWVVVPRWAANAAPDLRPRPRPDALIELSRNAFNLGPTSRQGFEALCRMLDDCNCHDFTYSRLEDAIATFEHLADER